MNDLFGSSRPAKKPAAPHPWPMLANHRCVVCGKRPAPFGVGALSRAPRAVKFFCSLEHRDQTK